MQTSGDRTLAIKLERRKELEHGVWLSSDGWIRIGDIEESGEVGMTTIQLTLPDQLAAEAERAGLLSPESLEEWLRKQLKVQSAAEFLSALDQLDAAGSEDYMSPEEVAEEIRVMRAEKRASRSV
jgi:hypothetical protein